MLSFARSQNLSMNFDDDERMAYGISGRGIRYKNTILDFNFLNVKQNLS